MINYWLFKSEPDTFGINHLAKKPQQITHWEGVRNYQARNMLRDLIKKNDLGFFYHSSCPEPGIAGIVKVVKNGYPDFTQFDPESQYFDPKSETEQPRWYMVDVQLVKRFPSVLPLSLLRMQAELKDMIILRNGNRLSITPVTAEEWEFINGLVEDK